VIDKFTKKKQQKNTFLESISRKKRSSSQKKQEKQGWNETCELEFEKIDLEKVALSLWWPFGKFGLGGIELQENRIRANNH